jgi:uncharacterized protein YdeI (BOF family)
MKKLIAVAVFAAFSTMCFAQAPADTTKDTTKTTKKAKATKAKKTTAKKTTDTTK